MKKNEILGLVFVILILAAIYFFYLQGVLNNDIGEPKIENFVSFNKPVIPDTPEKVYHDVLADVGIGECPPGNMGCAYGDPGTLQPLQNVDMSQFFKLIIHTVPKDNVWIQTETDVILAPPSSNGKILVADDLYKLKPTQIENMWKTGLCKTHNFCEPYPENNNPLSGELTKHVDPCNTTPVSLYCMRKMFEESGCTEQGSAYPSKSNYEQYSKTPYAQIKQGLAMLSFMKKDPAMKHVIAPMCTGGPVSNVDLEIKPEIQDNCVPIKPITPITCVKTALRQIYLSQPQV